MCVCSLGGGVGFLFVHEQYHAGIHANAAPLHALGHLQCINKKVWLCFLYNIHLYNIILCVYSYMHVTVPTCRFRTSCWRLPYRHQYTKCLLLFQRLCLALRAKDTCACAKKIKYVNEPHALLFHIFSIINNYFNNFIVA